MMQTAYLNNVLRLPAAAVLCLILFSACSGNADPPAPADQTTFNAALADITTAVTAEDYVAAEAAFVSFAAAYPNSSLVDDAAYYVGRAIHERALINLALPIPVVGTPTLADARTQYDKLKNTNSNKADNAQFYIGKTYFDALDYSRALTEFGLVLTEYTAPSAGDDAQYYIGRTKHEMALLGLPVSTPFTLANARDEYTALIRNYRLSTRRDDAQ